MASNISESIVDDMIAHGIDFVTSVPCKQLAGVIEYVENNDRVITFHRTKKTKEWGYVRELIWAVSALASSCKTQPLALL